MATSGLGRSFWKLWTAFSASNLGDGLSLVAMPLLAIELTDDARLIAAVTMFQFLPFLLIGLPAGVLLDRFDRRWIAVVAQILRASVLIALAVTILNGAVSIGILMGASFLVGVSEVMTDGGLPALVRELVRSDQLEVANARLLATQRVSNAFIGPPLGAVVFQLNSWLPFALASVMCLVSVGALVQLPGRYQSVQTKTSDPLRVQASMGLRYVWSHPVLRPLVLAVALFSFVGAASNAVFVVLLTQRFDLGGIGFGVIMSIGAIASVLTAFIVAPFIQGTSHSTSMRFSIVTFTTGSLLYGLGTVPAVAVVAVVLQGMADPTWNIVSSTVRQRLVPDEVFGRMMTAYLFIAWGMKPVGALIGGLVAQAWGPQWVSLGTAFVVGSLFVLARPMFQRVDAAMSEL